MDQTGRSHPLAQAGAVSSEAALLLGRVRQCAPSTTPFVSTVNTGMNDG
jgi:hypothetical protein